MEITETQLKPEKILCVDDEPNILSSLRRLFRSHGYQILVAQSGKEGLEILSKEPVGLVISDMRMPEMDGAQFLEQVRCDYPDCVRILLTGFSEVHSIVAAINRGEIHRYITKPWDENDILLVVKHALERKFLIDEKNRLEQLTRHQNDELKHLNANLEHLVLERTAELKTANEKLKENFLTSIKVFSSLIEMRGGKLAGHSRRVADLARKIAIKLRLETSQISDIFVAGLLVDIGKVGFSDELLSVAWNQMTGDQLGQFHKHTIRAEQVLMPLENLQQVAKILRSQHERMDGSGFPDRLSGAQIPVGTQILSVASDYDNLQNGSLMQRRMHPDEARDIISHAAGTRYSATVTTAFTDLLLNKVGDTPENHEVAVSQLLAGMELSADLFSKDGNLLLPSNYRLTDGIIEKIKLHASSGGILANSKIFIKGRHP
ncbi:response regulator RpfG family c-di-GMP phosphodiesterase [Oxalobacteraceae bacterium GrIS 1.18]